MAVRPRLERLLLPGAPRGGRRGARLRVLRDRPAPLRPQLPRGHVLRLRLRSRPLCRGVGRRRCGHPGRARRAGPDGSLDGRPHRGPVGGRPAGAAGRPRAQLAVARPAGVAGAGRRRPAVAAAVEPQPGDRAAAHPRRRGTHLRPRHPQQLRGRVDLRRGAQVRPAAAAAHRLDAGHPGGAPAGREGARDRVPRLRRDQREDRVAAPLRRVGAGERHRAGHRQDRRGRHTPRPAPDARPHPRRSARHHAVAHRCPRRLHG